MEFVSSADTLIPPPRLLAIVLLMMWNRPCKTPSFDSVTAPPPAGAMLSFTTQLIIVMPTVDPAALTAEASMVATLPLNLQPLKDQARWELVRAFSKMRLGLQMGLLRPVDVAAVMAKFQRVQLQQMLQNAIVREDYRSASQLRDRIKHLGEAA